MTPIPLPIDGQPLEDLCNLLFVEDHDIVILEAETGAGKTTRVPPAILAYLKAHNITKYRQLIATLPRRIATYAAATRVSSEQELELGGIVGYQTAFEHNYSRETKLLFCTDGLELVKELAGKSGRKILIIDELHEFNLNHDVLLAWVEHELKVRSDLKVVLMSATIDTESLSEFFNNCPVIKVPGRTYGVTRRTAKNMVGQNVRSLKEAKNVLAFTYGKSDIETISALTEARMNGQAVIVPLHAELTSEEHELAFKAYKKPKCVVATNIAETSLTIEDMDVVVDNGLVRINCLIDGIETLLVIDAPQDSLDQRAGRVGRTKHGEYYLVSSTPYSKRPKHMVAEIERVSLGQLVLRLAVIDVDASQLRFYHQPKPESIKLAIARLKKFGALEPNGKVTEIGRLMSRLPVDIHIARMVVEAQKRKVLEQVAIIAACIEAKSIRDHENDNWQALTRENQSDLLAEYDCYMRALSMTEDERKVAGIHEKRFQKAVEIRDHLERALKSVDIEIKSYNFDRNEVMKACISGLIDHIYTPIGNRKYVNGTSTPRELNRDCVLENAEDKIVVGIPFSVEIIVNNNRRPIKKMVDLILFPTIMPEDWKSTIESDINHSPTKSKFHRKSKRNSYSKI